MALPIVDRQAGMEYRRVLRSGIPALLEQRNAGDGLADRTESNHLRLRCSRRLRRR